MGIGMTLTLGGLGLWTLVDAFFIMGGIRKANEKIEMDILEKIALMKKARSNDEAAAATL